MAHERQATLVDYLAVLRRHKWIVLATVAVAIASAFFFSSRETPLYRASSQVFINPSAQLTGGAGGAAADAQARYLATEAALAHTPQVAAAAVSRAGTTLVSANKLISTSSVTSNASTNILTFSVTNGSRKVASRLVNAYAVAFTKETEKLDVANIARAINSLNDRILALDHQIDAAKSAGTSPAAARSQLSSLIKEREKLVQLKLVQPTAARISTFASGASQTQPDTRKAVAIGAALGIILGILLAFLRYTLDSRVRSSEEVDAALGMGLLTRLPRPSRGLRASSKLALLSDVPNEQREPYRQLRVAVDFANLRTKAQSILMTSAVAQEGKSTTIANLAVAIAIAGRDVTLVDLDLRQPLLHKMFDLPMVPGVTDVALGVVSLDEALSTVGLPGARRARKSPAGQRHGRLRILAAGTLPPDPAEFLETESLAQILADLRQRGGVVLLDCPPVVAVSDAITLSRHVDALMVCVDVAHLRKRALAELRRLLDLSPTPKLGYCLTGVDKSDGYGYGYGYGGPHVSSALEDSPPASRTAKQQAPIPPV